jgi:hypothetical protein
MRLASARAKPGTRPLLILGQAPSLRAIVFEKKVSGLLGIPLLGASSRWGAGAMTAFVAEIELSEEGSDIQTAPKLRPCLLFRAFRALIGPF